MILMKTSGVDELISADFDGDEDLDIGFNASELFDPQVGTLPLRRAGVAWNNEGVLAIKVSVPLNIS
jgi:hypothetical protein